MTKWAFFVRSFKAVITARLLAKDNVLTTNFQLGLAHANVIVLSFENNTVYGIVLVTNATKP